MFGGRFSHIKFSLQDRPETEILVEAHFIETIGSLVSLGENISVEHNFRENMHSQATLTQGLRFFNNFDENISAHASGARNFGIIIDFRENIKSEVYLASNILINNEFMENINANIFLGQNHSFAHSFIENINSSALLGKYYPFEVNFREAVLGTINGGIVNEEMFVITVAIPPGGELRIDSEYFTAALNGANILHQHSGDWIFILRETIDILIASDGNLTGELLYLEKFL